MPEQIKSGVSKMSTGELALAKVPLEPIVIDPPTIQYIRREDYPEWKSYREFPDLPEGSTKPQLHIPVQIAKPRVRLRWAGFWFLTDSTKEVVATWDHTDGRLCYSVIGVDYSYAGLVYEYR